MGELKNEALSTNQPVDIEVEAVEPDGDSDGDSLETLEVEAVESELAAEAVEESDQEWQQTEQEQAQTELEEAQALLEAGQLQEELSQTALLQQMRESVTMSMEAQTAAITRLETALTSRLDQLSLAINPPVTTSPSVTTSAESALVESPANRREKRLMRRQNRRTNRSK